MRAKGAWRWATVLVVVASSLGAGVPIEAAMLRLDTLAAWDAIVARIEARRALEARDGRRFLTTDFASTSEAVEVRRAARRGEVVVSPFAESDEATTVPSGMVHHWRGVVFVPGVGVDELIATVREPGGRRGHHQEDVLESRVLERGPDSLRLYLKLQRSSIVTVAYNTEHVVRYERIGAGRAASTSRSTHIAEIEGLGTAAEHERPVGDDRGFLWRLQSYWRYEGADGGVFVELESLTLTRDVPLGLGPVVRPIVDRVARESLARTLRALRDRF